jgi:hypothetical protein
VTAATTPVTSTNATTAANFNGVVPVLSSSLRHTFGSRYTYSMDDEAVLVEIQDNTKEAGQRLRASLSLLRSQGMLDDADYRELASRLSTSLAMVEAAYMEARRRG